MYYDKQIRYIDYLENGEKQRNCGYVKITVAAHRLLMDMQIKGLYETDDVASEVVLEGAGAEGRLGTVLIRQGSGSFQWEHQDPVNEGEALVLGQGLNYGQLERIRVQISPRRSLWCVWRESAPGRSGAKQDMTEQSASGGNASGQSAYEQNISDRKPGEIPSMTADAMPGREQNGVVGHRGAVPAEPVQWETGQESRAYPALRGEISETQGYAAMPEKATEAEGSAAYPGVCRKPKGVPPHWGVCRKPKEVLPCPGVCRKPKGVPPYLGVCRKPKDVPPYLGVCRKPKGGPPRRERRRPPEDLPLGMTMGKAAIPPFEQLRKRQAKKRNTVPTGKGGKHRLRKKASKRGLCRKTPRKKRSLLLSCRIMLRETTSIILKTWPPARQGEGQGRKPKARRKPLWKKRNSPR